MTSKSPSLKFSESKTNKTSLNAKSGSYASILGEY